MTSAVSTPSTSSLASSPSAAISSYPCSDIRILPSDVSTRILSNVSHTIPAAVECVRGHPECPHNDQAQPRRVSGVGWSAGLGVLSDLAPTSHPTKTGPIIAQTWQSTRYTTLRSAFRDLLRQLQFPILTMDQVVGRAIGLPCRVEDQIHRVAPLLDPSIDVRGHAVLSRS